MTLWLPVASALVLGVGLGFALGLRYAIRLSDILGAVLQKAAANTAQAVAYPGAVREHIDQITQATEAMFNDESSDAVAPPSWMDKDYDPFKVG